MGTIENKAILQRLRSCDSFHCRHSLHRRRLRASDVERVRAHCTLTTNNVHDLQVNALSYRVGVFFSNQALHKAQCRAAIVAIVSRQLLLLDNRHGVLARRSFYVSPAARHA